MVKNSKKGADLSEDQSTWESWQQTFKELTALTNSLTDKEHQYGAILMVDKLATRVHHEWSSVMPSKDSQPKAVNSISEPTARGPKQPPSTTLSRAIRKRKSVTEHVEVQDSEDDDDDDDDDDDAENQDSPESSPAALVQANARTDRRSRPRSASNVPNAGPNKRVRSSALEVPSIEIGLSKDCSKADLKVCIDKVIGGLDKLEIKIMKDRKEQMAYLTDAEKESILDLFVNDMMGKRSWDNLSELINTYNNPPTQEDPGLLRRSETLSKDTSLPKAMRAFYGSFGKDLKRRSSTNHMEDMRSGLELLNRYDALIELAEGSDPDLLDLLTKNHFTTGVGKGWKSAVIDFLAYNLEVPKILITETATRMRAVEAFVVVFGRGILPIIPEKQLRNIKRLGWQKLQPVCKLVKKEVPAFQPVCDHMYQNIYVPMSQGAKHLPIEFKSGRQPIGGTYLERIEAAVQSTGVPRSNGKDGTEEEALEGEDETGRTTGRVEELADDEE